MHRRWAGLRISECKRAAEHLKEGIRDVKDIRIWSGDRGEDYPELPVTLGSLFERILPLANLLAKRSEDLLRGGFKPSRGGTPRFS